jgi:hypothetical protein
VPFAIRALDTNKGTEFMTASAVNYRLASMKFSRPAACAQYVRERSPRCERADSYLHAARHDSVNETLGAYVHRSSRARVQ